MTKMRTLPQVQVFEFRPQLTHSIWVDYLSRARTLKGLVKEMQQGVLDGRFIGYRFHHVYFETLGIGTAPTENDFHEPW